jgi:hypothetical protein
VLVLRVGSLPDSQMPTFSGCQAMSALFGDGNGPRPFSLTVMAGEKHRHGLQEVLQAVEDALLKYGYDDFVVVTEHGSFHWITDDRARGRQAEEQRPQHGSH